MSVPRAPQNLLVRRGADGKDSVQLIQGFQQVSAGKYISPPMPPGVYDLYHTITVDWSVLAKTSFTILDRDLDLGQIIVRESVTIRGRVHQGEGDHPVSRARITLRALDLIDGMAGVLAPIADSSADGTFELRGIPQQAYRLEITGLSDNLYVGSARYGAMSLLSEPFVPDMTNDSTLDIALEVGGRVEGRVREAGETLASSGYVVLIPDENHRSNPMLLRLATVNAEGGFSIAGVAPGEYTIVAVRRLEAGEHLNGEFLRNQVGKGEKVTVARGTSSLVTVHLTRNQ
jgi:hypothetical protein